jgi:protein subunit release factor B
MSVSPDKLKALEEKMRAMGIREEDLVERFVRSRGHGGQKVNKTSTCVWLLHVPTGLEVKCMESRSQSLNRFLARRRLVEKIEERLLGPDSPAALERRRKRKQKDRRRRRRQSSRG